MAWTTPKTWAVGDVLKAADMNTYVRDNTNFLFGTGLQTLSDYTVSGSSIATYDTNTVLGGNIDQTFTDLELTVVAKGTSAGSIVVMTFNNDTGANYDREYVLGNTNSAFGGEAPSGTSIRIGQSISATADVMSTYIIDIPNYRSTHHKTAISREGSTTTGATGTINAALSSGFWHNNAAITRIALFMNAGNFDLDSRFILRGKK